MYQKYLKFSNKNDFYKFTSLHNGYCHVPKKSKALDKVFTKSHIKVLTNNSTAVACINKFVTSTSQ